MVSKNLPKDAQIRSILRGVKTGKMGHIFLTCFSKSANLQQKFYSTDNVLQVSDVVN